MSTEFKKAVGEIGDEDWAVLMKREGTGKVTETTRQCADGGNTLSHATVFNCFHLGGGFGMM